MKAVEFVWQIDAKNAIEVPPEIASAIQQGKAVRVIVLVAKTSIDQDWSQLTVDQLLAGYSDGDSIYDRLPAR